jgi:hypothetical protein
MNKMLGVLLLVVFTFVVGSRAQAGPPSLGTVSSPTAGSCPLASGWITGPGTVTCAHAYVDCSQATGAVSLGITFAYETPSSPNGTIVFFSGGDGTSPVGADPDPGRDIEGYAVDYYNAGYQVVQTAWDLEWEDPTSSTGGNIGYAACRPATFLNYINTTYYAPIHQAKPTAGMCAQGESGGSGANRLRPCVVRRGIGDGVGLQLSRQGFALGRAILQRYRARMHRGQRAIACGTGLPSRTIRMQFAQQSLIMERGA